jgi:hypothetical protein
VSVTPAGAAALGGGPAPEQRALPDHGGNTTPDYAAENARLNERRRVEVVDAEEEPRRAQAAPGGLTRFNDAVRNELGIDPETVTTFAGFGGIDLSTESDDALLAFFNTIKPGGSRRKPLDGFLGTLAKSGTRGDPTPTDDGAM